MKRKREKTMNTVQASLIINRYLRDTCKNINS